MTHTMQLVSPDTCQHLANPKGTHNAMALLRAAVVTAVESIQNSK